MSKFVPKYANHGEWLKSGTVAIRTLSDNAFKVINAFAVCCGLKPSRCQYDRSYKVMAFNTTYDNMDAWETAGHFEYAYDNLGDFLRSAIPTYVPYEARCTDSIDGTQYIVTIEGIRLGEGGELIPLDTAIQLANLVSEAAESKAALNR